MKMFILSFLVLLPIIQCARISSDQVQRQERRYHPARIQEQEIEIVYEEPNTGDEVIEVIEIEDQSKTTSTDRQPNPVTPSSIHKGLVPQLWENYTGPAEPAPETVPCNVARMKCAYRAGCGLALQNYALGCMDLVQGKTSVCNTHCRHSLIALLSTHEGQRLMKVSIWVGTNVGMSMGMNMSRLVFVM